MVWLVCFPGVLELPLLLSSSNSLPVSLPRTDGSALRRGGNAAPDSRGDGNNAARPSDAVQARVLAQAPLPARAVPLRNASDFAQSIADEQNLSRGQSLALGSYLQTQALVQERDDSGRELLVGVDTYA